MEMAKVTSKGQITIPVSIRRRLNINEGDKLLFIDSPDGVVMVNPDMLQSGNDLDMQQDIGISSVEKEPVRRPSPSAAEKKPVLSDSPPEHDSTIASSPISPVTNETTSQPAPVSDKPGAKVGGLDIGALLDEIRSIGSKI